MGGSFQQRHEDPQPSSSHPGHGTVHDESMERYKRVVLLFSIYVRTIPRLLAQYGSDSRFRCFYAIRNFLLATILLY